MLPIVFVCVLFISISHKHVIVIMSTDNIEQPAIVAGDDDDRYVVHDDTTANDDGDDDIRPPARLQVTATNSLEPPTHTQHDVSPRDYDEDNIIVDGRDVFAHEGTVMVVVIQ